MARDKTTSAPVVIIGIGNLLLRDEGVGIHVIRELRKMKLPDNVELVDGGTSGADLIDVIADRDKVIVVDAMKADAEPGAVFRMTGQDLLQQPHRSLSLHEFGLSETLMMARQLNCSPKQVIIFGVQPAVLRPPGIELSETIAAIVRKIAEAVLKEVLSS